MNETIRRLAGFDLKIRPARETDDLQALWRSAAETRPASQAPAGPPPVYAPLGTADVAEVGGVLAGCVYVDGEWIEGLCVVGPLRRRGIGSAMLAHGERRIRAGGESVANVSVPAADDTAGFYERHGWRADGIVYTDPRGWTFRIYQKDLSDL